VSLTGCAGVSSAAVAADATSSTGVPSAGHHRTSSVYTLWQRGQRFISPPTRSRDRCRLR
jgi:hypothetical protein